MPRIEDEFRALRLIKARWTPPHSYLRPSILGRPYSGDEGIREAIFWLRESALCWPGANSRDEEYERRIADLETVASHALADFEELRAVDPSVGTELRPYLFPYRIHGAINRKFWEMQSTSRFRLRDSPSIFELEASGLMQGWPHTKTRLASVLSLACVFRALVRLKDILDLWDSEFRYRAKPIGRPHFQFDFGNPEWDSLLYEIRVDPANVAFETERRLEAVAWIGRANDWMNFADEIHWAKSEQAYELAESERVKRSNAARQNIDARKEQESQNRKRVLAAFGRLEPLQKGRYAIGTIARATGLSRPTISKFLKEAGFK